MASVNDLILSEAIRHMVALQRYDNGVVARIIALLNRSDQRLMAELAARLEGLDAGSFSMQRLESLLTSVWSLNSEAYAQLGRALTEELKQFVPYEVSYQEQMLKTHLPVGVHVAAVSAEQVYAAALSRPFQGVLLQGVWSDLDASKLKRVRQAIAQGFVEGKTTDQITRELRGTRAKGYIDGLLQKDRRDIEAVVRTALAHTAGVAQDNVMEANADLIKASMWSSTLDLRTSPQCRIRDRLLYTPDTHKPIGHKVPWGAGPGRLHWRAVTEGTPVLTSSGWTSVESVKQGDLVLTHRGRWMPVLAARSKLCDSGVVRVIHTKSGRELRATDDHPVLTAGSGWKFAGALKAGDKLFCNPESLGEIFGAPSVVGTESQDCPSRADESQVAILRTIKLVAANVNLESEHEVRPSEVDDRCAEWVLRNPEVIEADECMQHHFLALAQALLECGCDALSKVLSSTYRHWFAAHALGVYGVEAVGSIGGNDFICDPRHASGVSLLHANGVHSVLFRRLFGESEGPMLLTSHALNASGTEVDESLLGLVAHRDAVLLGKVREAAIGKTKLSLDTSKRLSLVDMMLLDDASMIDLGFVHDEVLTLEVQKCNNLVYDLEVQGDASYIAAGVVVSNCRSGQVPVLKSYKELGIDLPDIEVNGRTRASMDGQVPKETSYADWLKNQSLARQTDVLGETRARLMRDGKLGMDAMYDSKGRFLTISELKQRDAEAFKRAGL
ncbi:hypothetical protein OSS46_28835 [Delftia tsuruhatensis]|nr:hypothetical protein [Delftia tsuruhatensis]MCX7509424.1 hypothetical protein [Delftia tsuruhatensis]